MMCPSYVARHGVISSPQASNVGFNSDRLFQVSRDVKVFAMHLAKLCSAIFKLATVNHQCCMHQGSINFTPSVLSS